MYSYKSPHSSSILLVEKERNQRVKQLVPGRAVTQWLDSAGQELWPMFKRTPVRLWSPEAGYHLPLSLHSVLTAPAPDLRSPSQPHEKTETPKFSIPSPICLSPNIRDYPSHKTTMIHLTAKQTPRAFSSPYFENRREGDNFYIWCPTGTSGHSLPVHRKGRS